MTTRKPRSAALPGDQEAYRGVAFERNESAEGWKRRKAQAEQITWQIMAKLEQVASLMQTLGALGWDGGGQPFVCETTMKKTRAKARADGSNYAYRETVRPRTAAATRCAYSAVADKCMSLGHSLLHRLLNASLP